MKALAVLADVAMHQQFQISIFIYLEKDNAFCNILLHYVLQEGDFSLNCRAKDILSLFFLAVPISSALEVVQHKQLLFVTVPPEAPSELRPSETLKQIS